MDYRLANQHCGCILLVNLFYHPLEAALPPTFFWILKNEYNTKFLINLKKYLTFILRRGNIYLANSFTKPYEKKSSLDGHSTESPVLVRWVDKSLDEDGLFLG